MNQELLRSKKGQEVEVFSYERRDHLLIEQKSFYKSILENHQVLVDIEDGLNAVEMIEDVLKSLETGESVVKN